MNNNTRSSFSSEEELKNDFLSSSAMADIPIADQQVPLFDYDLDTLRLPEIDASIPDFHLLLEQIDEKAAMKARADVVKQNITQKLYMHLPAPSAHLETISWDYGSSDDYKELNKLISKYNAGKATLEDISEAPNLIRRVVKAMENDISFNNMYSGPFGRVSYELPKSLFLSEKEFNRVLEQHLAKTPEFQEYRYKKTARDTLRDTTGVSVSGVRDKLREKTGFSLSEKFKKSDSKKDNNQGRKQ
jgi:hypothetical protein